MTISAPRPRATIAWVLAAAVPLAGGALLWNAARTSTPVSVDAALHGFRAAAPSVPAAARPGVPAAGVYSYAATGHERGNVGPLGIDRDVPAEARYIVTPSPGGFTAELRVSGEHTEAYRYVVAAGWVRMAWRRVDVTFLRLGRDDRRDVVPAARWLPVRPRVGQAWPVAYATGTLRTTGRGEVVRRGVLAVGGAPEAAWLVRTTTRTTGAHGGTRVEEVWWSPRLAMPLRMTTDTRLGGVIGLRASLDLRLASPAPLR